MTECHLSGNVVIDGAKNVNRYEATIEQDGQPIQVSVSDYGQDGTIDTVGYSFAVPSPEDILDDAKDCEDPVTEFVKERLPQILAEIHRDIQDARLHLVFSGQNPYGSAPIVAPISRTCAGDPVAGLHTHYEGTLEDTPILPTGILVYLSDFDDDGRIDELRIVEIVRSFNPHGDYASTRNEIRITDKYAIDTALNKETGLDERCFDWRGEDPAIAPLLRPFDAFLIPENHALLVPIKLFPPGTF